jgi:hypothetical protein
MNKDKLFKHELSLLFLERSKIWLGYDGTDGKRRMEETRRIDFAIAMLVLVKQRRIDAAIRGKQ